MDPISLLLLASVGLIGGGISSAVQYGANRSLQHDAQNFNAEQAQLNRDFQAEQNNLAYQRASTAYQTAVKDMKSAGLNPALAGGVSPTFTPSSATGNMASSGISSIGSPSLGVNSLISAFTSSAVKVASKNSNFAKMLLASTASQLNRDDASSRHLLNTLIRNR